MTEAGEQYRIDHRRSIDDPEGYWADQAGAIDWFRRPTVVLETETAPHGRWFTDGVLNTCYNALDRHVIAGRADHTALVHHSAITGQQRSYSYAELLDHVARIGGALTALGVRQGDRVLIYLPMVAEAAMAMLACARIGAVHAVVFGGFAASELAARIDDARPTVLLTASCGLEASRVIAYKPFVDEALEKATHTVDHVMVLQRPELAADLVEPRDVDWRTMTRPGAFEPAVCVDVVATDPFYILHTSGTTGRPKGIVRDNGGHAVALCHSMRTVFDVGPEDVMFTASDVGWVVGHSYIVYAPLLVGATTVMYEGKPVGTPDAGAFWKVVADHGVTCMFTAPTAIRAIRRLDPDGELIKKHDLSSLRHLFLAGERLDPDTWQWSGDHLGVPVIDNWWQTETGWPIAANLRGLDPMPIKPGSPTVPVPGYDVVVLGPDSVPVSESEGAICLRLPLPPGTLTGVWQDEERFAASYLSAHEGYYLTGDGGHIDADGYLFVMGRTDDVINVAGHRLSAGAIEAVLASHQAVAECAVIGVHDELKGDVPRGLVVLSTERDHEELTAELLALVRREVGAFAGLAGVDVVAGLPKTRSGKILRRTMRQIADGEDPAIPSTIEDPAVLEALTPILRRAES